MSAPVLNFYCIILYCINLYVHACNVHVLCIHVTYKRGRAKRRKEEIAVNIQAYIYWKFFILLLYTSGVHAYYIV